MSGLLRSKNRRDTLESLPWVFGLCGSEILVVLQLQKAMSSYRLPPISSVPTLPSAERAAILDHLFEPSTPLYSLSLALLHDQSFPSYDDLITTVGVQLVDLAESSSTSNTQWLDSILGAHPRLGESNVESTQSQGEQAHLESGQESDKNTLAELNASYERAFPGLRYV